MAGNIRGMIQLLSGLDDLSGIKASWGSHPDTWLCLKWSWSPVWSQTEPCPFHTFRFLVTEGSWLTKGGMAPCTLPTTLQWNTGPPPWPGRTFFHQKKQLCKQNCGRRFWVDAFYARFLPFLFLAKCRPNYCFENATPFVQQPIPDSNSTLPSWGSSRRGRD